jgi:hypothetical protein
MPNVATSIEAVKWEAKAIALAGSDKTVKPMDMAEANSCLRLYKAGKPFREALKK